MSRAKVAVQVERSGAPRRGSNENRKARALQALQANQQTQGPAGATTRTEEVTAPRPAHTLENLRPIPETPAPEAVEESPESTAEISPVAEGAAEPALPQLPPDTEPPPTPSFQLPEMPATELSPEAKAARQAELAQAKAAIAGATDASGTVDAFAEAPPSVKARTQGGLDARIGRLAQADKDKFTGNLPDFHAEMGGTPLSEQEQVPPVRIRSAQEILLEKTPPPALQPELPLLPDPAAFLGNESVLPGFDNSFDERAGEVVRQQAVETSLEQVRVEDSAIETPGPPPQVALEGDTNLERLDEQKRASHDAGRQARQEAGQGVIEGPGPERVQLKALDESYAVYPEGVPAPLQVEAQAGAPGAGEFLALGLPEEVAARFDADQHEGMRANLGEAQQKVSEAEKRRDQDRENALDDAETKRQEAVDGADQDQRQAVLDGRKEIQSERQATLDAQSLAVHEFEQEADRKSGDKGRELRGHISRGEGEIAREYKKVAGEVQKEAGKTRKEADQAREEAKKKSKKRSWWQRAKSWVKDKIAALKNKISGLINRLRKWVRKKLNEAREWAKRKIDQIASFVKDAINAFRNVLKGLVNGLLGHTFPGLAKKLNDKIDSVADAAIAKVDQVADALKAKVDEIVDRLQKALDAVFDFFEKAINFALTVLAAAITGDWGEVLRLVLEAVLGLLGIDPETFYSFIGQALSVIGSIVKSPGTFLSNCVEAVLQGVRQFAGNFLEHLQAGIIRWLTGALGDVDVPKSFDLQGVLHLGRQVLGLDWPWLRRRAVKLVGEENVERAEFVLEYVETVREEGWGALFTQIQDQLTGLADLVLGQIKDYLVERVILAAVKWIGALFTPVGALVKLAFTIWNLFLFLKDQIRRIAGIVQTVISTISDIAKGVLDVAAAGVESALVNLLPVAISLLASLLDLGNVGNRTREVIGGIRERFENATDRLLARVVQRFRPGRRKKSAPAALEADPAGTGTQDSTRDQLARDQAARDRLEGPEGEKTAQAAAVGKAGTEPGAPPEPTASFLPGRAAATQRLGRDLTIPREGMDAAHLFITAEGQEATVMLRASPPRPLITWLRKVEATAKASPRLDTEYSPVIKEAFVSLLALDKASDRLASARWLESRGDRSPRVTALIPKLQQEVQDHQQELHGILVRIMKSPTLREQKSVENPLDAIFAEDLDKVHEDARVSIRATLNHKGDVSWETMRWPMVQEKLVAAQVKEKEVPLPEPLTGGGKYAKNLREALHEVLEDRSGRKVEIAGKEYEYPAEELIGSLRTRHVQDFVTDSRMPHVVQALRQAVFTGQNHEQTASETLQPAILAGLQRFLDSSTADPEFLAALAQKRPVDAFLKAIALGETIGGVNRGNWDLFMSRGSNKEEVEKRFRDLAPTPHEWIPTHYVTEVLTRAIRNIDGGELPIVSILWIDLQNAFRAPTSGILFKPDKAERRREVTCREAPHRGQKVTVLQGHPGASYAPVDKNEKFLAEPKQQTKGSPDWHEQLNAIYESETGETLAAMRNIWVRVRKHWQESTWKGEDRAELAKFDEYYDTTKNVIRFPGLESRHTAAQAGVEEGFRKAAGIIADAKYMKLDPRIR